MADAALQTWLRDYRATHPQLDPAWIFLARDPHRDVYGAFEILKQEWLDAVYAIRAPNVAATKLQWWLDEIRRAHAAQAMHPLTRAIFADAAVRAIPLAQWNEVFHCALLQMEAAPAADFAAQLGQAAPLQSAITRLETALWFGPDAGAQRAQAIAAVQRVSQALRNLAAEVDCGRTPLPMSLLARHGLSQNALLEDGEARRAALRDQIADLLRASDGAAKLPGPLTLFRGLQMHLDRRALRKAGESGDPLHVLREEPRGVRNLLYAWVAARAWHAEQPHPYAS